MSKHINEKAKHISILAKHITHCKTHFSFFLNKNRKTHKKKYFIIFSANFFENKKHINDRVTHKNLYISKL